METGCACEGRQDDHVSVICLQLFRAPSSGIAASSHRISGVWFSDRLSCNPKGTQLLTFAYCALGKQDVFTFCIAIPPCYIYIVLTTTLCGWSRRRFSDRSTCPRFVSHIVAGKHQDASESNHTGIARVPPPEADEAWRPAHKRHGGFQV